MNFEELFTLSLRAIAANKLRSFLTTLGIIIGVFSIIVLVSIGSGLQTYVTNQLAAFGPNLIDVLPGNSNNFVGSLISTKLTVQDGRNIQKRIVSTGKAAPIIEELITVKYKNKKDNGAYAAGTTFEYPEIVRNLKMSQGTFFTKGQEQSGARVVVIGNTIYKKFFNGENAIGKRIYIGENLYSVVGVASSLGSSFGVDQDNIAYITIEAAQSQFGTNIVREIVATSNTDELLPVVINQIRQALLQRLTEDDFTIQTAESISSTVSSITTALSLALGGIAAISLLVGGIGVANIMLVSVTERTREIGLRKALGARRKDILTQFLLESVMISVTGGLVGIALGMVASFIIAKLLVSTVTPWSMILAFGFSVLVGVIFGMAPAIRASKLNPIEALRYE